MSNKITPFLSTSQNNRDHRKICVIDGKVAYTGGVNLGDEYINRKVRFGHWKDTAVMLKGDAVQSFTMMFLQMWNIEARKPEDYRKYLTPKVKGLRRELGYVIPCLLYTSSVMLLIAIIPIVIMDKIVCFHTKHLSDNFQFISRWKTDRQIINE